MGGFGEAKILYFPTFFVVFLKLKFERCFESKNLRKKRQTDAGVTHFGPGRRNVRGAGERKREGFRSLLGQNSGKKYFLCKHFRCSDRRKPLPFESSTLVPGGAAERRAQSAGRPSFRQWLENFIPKTFPNPPQTFPKPSPNPPVITNWLPNGLPPIAGRILGQLGSILEALEPSKSRPKPEKIDVEKSMVFGLDF